MYLADREKEVPTQWEHDPAMQDCCGRTVAMLLARRRMIVPTRWHHDPVL